MLYFPATGIKKAMATAALETAWYYKKECGSFNIYSRTQDPDLGKTLVEDRCVRSADMNKTPDMRTRAYLLLLVCGGNIKYVQPTLSAYSIVSLLRTQDRLLVSGTSVRKRATVHLVLSHVVQS